MLEFSIITITAFVSVLDTTLILILKNFCKGDYKRVIPLFSIIFGIGLGVAGYYTKNVEMGSNLIEAIFIGLSAGAAATGIDQVSKQLSKKNVDDTTKPIDKWTDEDWAKAREIITSISCGKTDAIGDIMLMGNNVKDVINELDIKPTSEETEETSGPSEEDLANPEKDVTGEKIDEYMNSYNEEE